jgi:hypothetical protein
LWHIDSLIGNDRETNETTVVYRQRLARINGSTIGSDVFCVVRSEAIWFDRPSTVSQCYEVEYSAVKWDGEQSVRGLLPFGLCELLLLEAGSWGIGIVRELKVRGKSVVESRYQTSTDEDKQTEKS